MRPSIQPVLWFLALTGVAVLVYNILQLESALPEITYSVLLEKLEAGQVAEIHLQGGRLRGLEQDGTAFSSFAPDVPAFLALLQNRPIRLSAEAEPGPGMAGTLRSLLPVLLILGGWYIYMRSSGGPKDGFKDGKTRRFTPESGSRVTFRDVAGMAEAQAELKEIVDFLKHPERFSRLGGRIPKGVLLQGPPGTGKTLLAKAIAGEASVPFFSMGGSDFVEMFVGVGASRVRELFVQAKKQAPCIVFIDEIDAIGGRRSGAASGGGSDEREQTLNALLVEMDGFASTETVIVIAATNRPDILDPALLRPGRFDRQVTVGIPDLRDRMKILSVHLDRVAASASLNLDEIARAIPGFSGADIANLINESALTAARNGKNAVDMEDIEHAKDKIIMGLERKSLVLSEEARRTTAYHEAGHAVVAKLLRETDPLHKITIIPRGRALGITQQLPLDDRLTYSREYLLNRIKILLGGRIAEELVFGRLSTGASNDIQAVTDLASRLVCEWGMSRRIGPVAYLRDHGGFLGQLETGRPFSEETAATIDTEIRQLIAECADEARDLLRRSNRFLHKLAETLLVNETLDAEEIDIVYHYYLTEHEMEKRAFRNGPAAISP